MTLYNGPLQYFGLWTHNSSKPRGHHECSGNVTQPQHSSAQSKGEGAFGILAKNGPFMSP